MRPVEQTIIRCACGRWAFSSPCFWCRSERTAAAKDISVTLVRHQTRRERIERNGASKKARKAVGL